MADLPNRPKIDRTEELYNLAPWIEQEALPPHLVALAETLAEAVSNHAENTANCEETTFG